MTESTQELDRLIKDALRQDEAELLDRFGEQSTGELLTESFRGRRRLLAIGGVAANLWFFGVAIFAGVRFVRADDERSMILWGAVVGFCLGTVTAIKIWYWLEMSRLALARDIKRVELQVALLSQQLAGR